MHLYVHVPFCRRKCSYCGFASAPPEPGDVQNYIRAVIREMQLQSPKVQGRRIQTLFLGGGTPSMLSPVHVQRLLDAARQYFALDDGAEITLEANPDSVYTPTQVRAWRDMGVNRISLGVQSLDRDVLHFLGRTHSPEKARGAVHCLDQAGVDNWSLDLIWGIPGQDVQSWLQTLEEVLAWAPAHLSLYSLCIEPDTPLAGREWEHGLDWPGENTWEEMFLYGRELLLRAGFVHYEISNYARPGRECRHNSGIWRGEDYMGLGPSAVSTVNAIRGHNPDHLADYVQMMDTGTHKPQEEILSREVQGRERVMLGLRTRRGIDGFEAGVYFEDGFVDHLMQSGLLEAENGRMRLTPQGMLVSNEVLARMRGTGKTESLGS